MVLSWDCVWYQTETIISYSKDVSSIITPIHEGYVRLYLQLRWMDVKPA
jgi:hypothetical protein